jgi:hypothetical protein
LIASDGIGGIERSIPKESIGGRRFGKVYQPRWKCPGASDDFAQLPELRVLKPAIDPSLGQLNDTTA